MSNISDEKEYAVVFNQITGKIDAAKSLAALENIVNLETRHIQDNGAKSFFHKVNKKLDELGTPLAEKNNVINIIADKSNSTILKEKCLSALELI